MKIKFEEKIEKLLTDESAKVLDEKYRKEQLHHFSAWADTPKQQQYLSNLFYTFQRHRNYKLSYIGESTKVNYTLKEMVNISLDFAKSLHPEIYERAINILNNKDTTLLLREPTDNHNREEMFAGLNFDGKQTKAIISLKPQNSILGLTGVIHEVIGHGTSQKMQEKVNIKIDCLSEFEAQFVELVALDWLLEKGYISSEDYKIESVRKYVETSFKVKFIQEEVEICKRLKLPITKDNLTTTLDALKTEENYKPIVRHLFNQVNGGHSSRFEYRYVFGLMISSLLYEDFKKNPKETIEKYNNYMKKSSEYTKVDDALKDLIGEKYNQRIKGFVDSGIKTK